MFRIHNLNPLSRHAPAHMRGNLAHSAADRTGSEVQQKFNGSGSGGAEQWEDSPRDTDTGHQDMHCDTNPSYFSVLISDPVSSLFIGSFPAPPSQANTSNKDTKAGSVHLPGIRILSNPAVKGLWTRKPGAVTGAERPGGGAPECWRLPSNPRWQPLRYYLRLYYLCRRPM